MDRIRRPVRAAENAALRIEQFLESSPWLFPLCLCLVTAIFGIILSQHRRLWFDEIGTILSLRSMAEKPLLDYIRGGGDLAPPFYFVLGSGMRRLVGDTPFVARYLAVAATCLAQILLFVLVRRWLGVREACLAVVLFLHTAALSYLSEGRPYSVTIAASALAILAWDHVNGPRRGLAIVGMAIAASAALALHYYAVFLLFPLGAGQLVRDFLRRKLDIPVWTGIVSPLAVLAAHIPLVRAGQAVYGKHAWQNLNPPSIADIYRFLFQDAGLVICLFLFCYWLLSRRQGLEGEPASLQPHIWGFLGAFLLIPVVAHTAGRVTGMMPVDRYLIFTVIGLSLAPVCLIAVWRPLVPLVHVAVLLLAVLSLGRAYRNEFRKQTAGIVSFPWLRANISTDDGPVLTTDTHLFLQLAYYRASEQLPRIQYPDSIENNIRYLGEDSGVRNLIVYRNTFPDIGLYAWQRPAAGPWRYQSVRKKGRDAWELTEALRLGGSVRLLRAGEGLELFAVEIPAP